MSVSMAASEYSVRVISGKLLGREYALLPDRQTLVGSAPDADLALPDRGVAQHHARIAWTEGAPFVEALPKAALRVNGAAKKRASLHNGDQIGIGDAVLRVTQRARTSAREHDPMAESARPKQEKAPGPKGEDTAAPPEEQLAIRRVSESERQEALAKAEQARLWWAWNELPPLELQHIWFELARDTDWRSLAVVPTDEEVPALAVAHAFARMASLDPQWRVLVVDASPTEAEGVTPDRPLVGTVASAVMRYPGANYDFLDAKSLGLNEAEVAHLYIPQLLDYISSGSSRHNKVIIALGPLVQYARSIPIARAVDSVVLAVGLGDSRIPDVRRAVDIVGKSRVKGSFVVAYK